MLVTCDCNVSHMSLKLHITCLNHGACRSCICSLFIYVGSVVKPRKQFNCYDICKKEEIPLLKFVWAAGFRD